MSTEQAPQTIKRSFRNKFFYTLGKITGVLGIVGAVLIILAVVAVLVGLLAGYGWFFLQVGWHLVNYPTELIK